MTKDKVEDDGRESAETMLERLKELTRKVVSVSKAEVDRLAEREKAAGRDG